MQAIERDIREFVSKNFLFGKPAAMAADASFRELGIIDSTGVLELVGFLESHFGLKVENDEIHPNHLDSIAKLARFVAAKGGRAREEAAGDATAGGGSAAGGEGASGGRSGAGGDGGGDRADG